MYKNKKVKVHIQYVGLWEIHSMHCTVLRLFFLPQCSPQQILREE